MMAMMGALDEMDINDHSHGRRSRSNPRNRQHSPAHSPIRDSRTLDRSAMVIDELENTSRSNRGQPKRSSVKGTLSELKNLQQETVKPRSKSQSPGRRGRSLERGQGQQIHEEYVQQQNVQQNQGYFNPKFLRLTAERDTSDERVRFPPVPTQAWSAGPSKGPMREEDVNIPLLNLHGVAGPSRIFPGVHKYPTDLPPAAPQATPPNYFEIFNANQQEEQENRFGIPLLKLPDEKKPLLGPQPVSTFGRLLAPHLIIQTESERQQKELLKKRHQQEFHKLQVCHI